MDIEQFGFSSDNLGYLVYNDGRGIAIDGGDPVAIASFAKAKGIRITTVTNTHNHPDHTPGNAGLLELTGAEFMDCRSFAHGQKLPLGGQSLEVLLTPGHTTDSVCFKGAGFVVTGDTLFNGTVGNCFSGDLNAFYHSLELLMALPGTTRIYAGHDYVAESLKYAQIIEPGNPALKDYGEKYNPGLVVSCMEDELKVNPYLRFNVPSMIRRLEEKKLPRETAYQRFSSIMELY
ncbi:MAG: MBL fold metallo-hydrolase [Desulfobacter sp.]|nr:MAG: MBL fold metallo-hydrolase [Desulfobacter sp.]